MVGGRRRKYNRADAGADGLGGMDPVALAPRVLRDRPAPPFEGWRPVQCRLGAARVGCRLAFPAHRRYALLPFLEVV